MLIIQKSLWFEEDALCNVPAAEDIKVTELLSVSGRAEIQYRKQLLALSGIAVLFDQ